MYDPQVRYLRMLSNSVIAGLLASAYLTVLMLQINPEYPREPARLGALALTLGLAYGINLIAGFYALIVLRQILAAEVLSPGWVSVRLLAWLFTLAATGGAVVMWLNLRGLAPVLDLETTRRMAAGAIVVSAAAAVFLVMAIAHLGRRGGRASAAILVLVAAASVVLPVLMRGPSRPPEIPALPSFRLQAALSATIGRHELDYWTGTVYTTNRRVWEHDEKFKDYLRTIRASAIDMETATIFVVGFVNHIPKGALLLVSDNPMTPEGVKTSVSDASVTEQFVRTHLEVGIDTLIELRDSGARSQFPEVRQEIAQPERGMNIFRVERGQHNVRHRRHCSMFALEGAMQPMSEPIAPCAAMQRGVAYQ